MAAGHVKRTNFISVIQVPYFDDIDVNDIYTVLNGLMSEVETRPKVSPIS